MILGSSPAIAAVCRTLDQVAQTDATVLVLGETGTGKELVARTLHARSKRKPARSLPQIAAGSCPGWQMLDDNTAAVMIAADSTNLYQLHNTGKIWRYTGTPCSGSSCPGWQMLDDNTAAV